MVVSADGHSRQPRVNPQAAELKAFADRVRDYVELRSKAESGLPKLGTTEDAARIEAHRRALAAAIQAARASARQGDVFGEAAKLIRRIVAEDARARPARDRHAAMREVPSKSPPGVNAPYPEPAAVATVPPLLLTRLPQLPDGLEYRFMGRDLILHDAKAHLIVDIVPEAVPLIRS